LESVRKTVGDDVLIAVDVNNKWDLHKALECAPALERFDVAWLEEPLYPFDVAGHAKLAASINTPLLHGENIYECTLKRYPGDPPGRPYKFIIIHKCLINYDIQKCFNSD